MSRMAVTMVATFSMVLIASSARAAEVIDFRYAPPWWQTSICLPDDWQKTLVGKSGELLYDWGGGRYSGFKTRISVGVSDVAVWQKQELVSPRLPIVRTTSRIGDVQITQEAFAAPPGAEAQAAVQSTPPQPPPPPPPIQAASEHATLQNWAAPTVKCDDSFHHIAVGYNAPIRYRYRCQPDRKYTVVFGLCEGWHQERGQRILDLQIEGKTVKTIDMIASHGRNLPAVPPFAAKDENGDGWIDIGVAPAKDSPDKNTILNAIWVFDGDAPPTQDIISGKANKAAWAYVACGLGGPEATSNNPPRNDIVLMTLKNTGASAVTVSPMVTVESAFGVSAGTDERSVRIGTGTKLTCTLPFHVEQPDGGRTLWMCEPVKLNPGEQKICAIGVARGREPKLVPTSADQAIALRTEAEDFWKNANLPYGHIEVPDPGVQALVDSSIRNIYQAREIKEGLPAFQVGPTCYRGLWVVDGSFLMEAVAMMGRTDEARNGIKYLLKRQGKDGGFMLIGGHWKETGIVLWAVSRHAKLTGDKAWLQSVWPNVERGFAYIQNMRKNAAADANAPNYRLVPAGFSDGGLAENCPEYTNVYWTLAGVKAAVASARWLGKNDEADAWQTEYDDFLATFRQAAERDMKTDAHGNRCLPIFMVNGLRVPPQKAQWAFLHAIFPGQVFAADDPLVKGNMAMLRAAECEGLVQDTGWLKDGIWNYFGSFYAHAWLWLGEPQKAAQALYAFGNHASPLLVWREEHMPQGKGGGLVGDMPHNWASAEFIRLVRDCLVLERGDELHLLEAMPAEWTKPGMITRLKDIETSFGPISLAVRIDAAGGKARVTVDVPKRTPPAKMVLHLGTWSGKQGVVSLPTSGSPETEIQLTR